MTKYVERDHERFDRIYDLALAETLDKFGMTMDQIAGGKQRDRTVARAWMVGVLLFTGMSLNQIGLRFEQPHTTIRYWSNHKSRRGSFREQRAVAAEILRQL